MEELVYTIRKHPSRANYDMADISTCHSLPDMSLTKNSVVHMHVLGVIFGVHVQIREKLGYTIRKQISRANHGLEDV